MLDGSTLSLFYALPFIGLLFSIAAGPVLFPHFWEHHYGKISIFWMVVALLMMLVKVNPLTSVAHVLYEEYIPFIVLIFALYTVSGGLVLRGNLHGSPQTNTTLLAVGMLLASFIGTTGASMVMIRPLLRANDNRRYSTHTVVFFIFLVANIGGSLTPLGDPPLFIGFLKGVDFFWTVKSLWLITIVSSVTLLAVFFIMDRYFYKKEAGLAPLFDPTPDNQLRLLGKINLLLIIGIISAVLIGAKWKTGVTVTLPMGHMPLENLMRDITLLGLVGLSMLLTKKSLRAENNFTFAPILEVAKLFLGIFICMIPVIAMLHAGKNGAFAPLVTLVTNANGSPNIAAYFWATGILSSFLDNAPTYLMFFELAGGNAQTLMSEGKILSAISAGAVFMGANSYIGNAPNFMVYAIAKQAGVKMPSFFGYMLWSGAILIPLFIVLTFLFFKQ
jgi:Na+/H+ antiporter NhaD/arsenite permease-like protein